MSTHIICEERGGSNPRIQRTSRPDPKRDHERESSGRRGS